MSLLTKCLQNHVFVSLVLTILVLVILTIYFWNYIRLCYYASKFPGPPAYPIIGNATLLFGSHEEKTHRLIDLSNQYQSSMFRVWLGPLPVLATSDPDIIQVILTNPNALEKAYIMKLVWESAVGMSILTSEVPEWKNHRSIIVRGFTPIILKSYFKIFVEKINILTQKLDLELNKETSFDIFEYFSRTTLDSVCGSTMGVNINAHEDDSPYFNAVHSVLHLIMARLFNIFKLPTIFFQLTNDYRKLSKYTEIVQEFTENVIAEKRKNYVATQNNNLIDAKAINKNEYKKPLLEYLMDFTENNLEFNDGQLRDESNLIIMAAYETSANALSNVLLQLAVHKAIQTKVYEEINEVLSETNGSSINFDDLPKLKYMDMVIKESMRLISTVPVIGRELSQDIKIGKYTIPKGATVIIPIFTVHRNENHWKNALKFDPERFTPTNIKNHPYAYIPFSAGPRNRIGMRYSWTLMKTTLATLLSRYEFHTDLNLNELRFEAAISLKLVNGYLVRITPRQKRKQN